MRSSGKRGHGKHSFGIIVICRKEPEPPPAPSSFRPLVCLSACPLRNALFSADPLCSLVCSVHIRPIRVLANASANTMRVPFSRSFSSPAPDHVAGRFPEHPGPCPALVLLATRESKSTSG